MFLKRYGNLILGIFFLCLSSGYFLLTTQLPDSKVNSLGPRFAPYIIATLVFVVALLLTVTSIRKLVKTRAETTPTADVGYWRVLFSMTAFCCYVYSFGLLGFPVATFIYLVVQMSIMAPKEKINLPLFCAIAFVTSGSVYYVFRYRLDVMLPPGILGR